MTPEKTKALEEAIEKLLTEEGSTFDASAFFAYCENMGEEPSAETLEAAEDCYIGEYDSPKAFAYEYAENIGLFDCLPKNGRGTHTLELYFDWDFWARDLQIGGDVFENNGHWFRNS